MLAGDGRRVSRTVALYCASQFFEGFALIYPAYLVLFRRQGLSIASISVLLACATIPVILLEVPSGVLADRFGRRLLIVSGLLLKAGGFALWGLGGFASYAAGFVLWGAQEAFCSGAQEALLYDALKQAGAQASYARAAGYARASSLVATALAMALGGHLAEYSTRLVLAATVASTLVAAAIAALLPEPPQQDRCGSQSMASILREAVAACAGQARLRSLILYGSLIGAAYGLIDEYDQLFIESVGFALPLIGLLGCVRFLIEAAAAGLAPRIGAGLRLGDDRRLGAYLVLAGASLAVAALAPPAVALACYGAAYVIFSSGSVLFEQRVQESIESAGRATVMSAASLAVNVCALLLALLLGLLSELGGIRACIGGIAVCGILVPLLFARGAESRAEPAVHEVPVVGIHRQE